MRTSNLQAGLSIMLKPAGGSDFDKNLLSLQVGIGKPRFYFKEILPQNMALIVFITN